MEKFQITANRHSYVVQRTGLFQKIYKLYSKYGHYEIGLNQNGNWEFIDSGYPSESINLQEVGKAIEKQEAAVSKQFTSV